MMTHLAAFLAYVQAVVTDGDYANDFIMSLPAIVRPIVEAFGQWLARILGA